MRSALVAHVAVDRTAYHFDKPYDYLVPFDMIDGAKVGCRVLVPFGTGNRKRQGMILSVAKMGNDSLLEIAFDEKGTKKLMANFAKLEII